MKATRKLDKLKILSINRQITQAKDKNSKCTTKETEKVIWQFQNSNEHRYKFISFKIVFIHLTFICFPCF